MKKFIKKIKEKIGEYGVYFSKSDLEKLKKLKSLVKTEEDEQILKDAMQVMFKIGGECGEEVQYQKDKKASEFIEDKSYSSCGSRSYSSCGGGYSSCG